MEVAELVHPYTGQWDEHLVQDLFWKEDADLILAIPVHQGRDDTIAWHFDKHKIFNVKSAYKVAHEALMRSRLSSGQQGGSNTGPSGLWKVVWKLKCPNKIKHFLW